MKTESEARTELLAELLAAPGRYTNGEITKDEVKKLMKESREHMSRMKKEIVEMKGNIKKSNSDQKQKS